MTIQHYRLCFDAPVGKRFENYDAFAKWAEKHLAPLNYRIGGYMIRSADELIHQPGIPTWFVLIEGADRYDAFNSDDVICWLAARHWMVDGIRVMLFIKHPGENETLFPIVSAS